jgi:hypothetical protein
MPVNVHNPLAECLRSRVSHFIADPIRSHSTFSLVREDLRLVIRRIASRNWDAVMFGGTLRDLMLKPSNWLPRDIDIVVDRVSNDELADEFSDLLARRTRFGGLHLKRHAVFDLWSLPSTWAINAFGLPKTFEELPKTTFLNIEAVAIELCSQRGRGRTIHSDGFFDSLRSKTLEINLEPNPFPELCIVRSLIMAAKLDFAIGERLARYLIKQRSLTDPKALIDVQLQHYGIVRLTTREIDSWLHCIEADYERSNRITLPVSKERQNVLWDWPLLAEAPPTFKRRAPPVGSRRPFSPRTVDSGPAKLF